MKIEIPQIYWHGDRDRIMSLDFFPNSNLLVTCGGESEEKHFIKVNFLMLIFISLVLGSTFLSGHSK